DSSLLHLSLRLVVPRSFFSLSSIIDLTPLSTSSTAVVTVEAILRGDKPRKSTMKIKISLHRLELELFQRHNSSSSMVQLLSLLILIWLAGDGVFPVAKRVTIGVLADM
ncbi:hypothetical protein PMAYCL1PPCAC_13537, partial [Pristionchus mayeri]